MARVTTWLFIESDEITVDSLNQRIGVTCDWSWKKGDARGKTGKSFTANAWKLGSTTEVGESSGEVLDQIKASLTDIVNRMSGNEARFRAVAAQGASGLFLGIRAEAAPAIILDSVVLTGISALGVDLEIDLVLG